jgi:hypothetical protein
MRRNTQITAPVVMVVMPDGTKQVSAVVQVCQRQPLQHFASEPLTSSHRRQSLHQCFLLQGAACTAQPISYTFFQQEQNPRREPLPNHFQWFLTGAAPTCLHQLPDAVTHAVQYVVDCRRCSSLLLWLLLLRWGWTW